eukprot:jgi/Bigna1/65827/fgenesh1_kg.131_\
MGSGCCLHFHTFKRQAALKAQHSLPDLVSANVPKKKLPEGSKFNELQDGDRIIADAAEKSRSASSTTAMPLVCWLAIGPAAGMLERA